MDSLVDFFNWAWARHHNPLSWYVRPVVASSSVLA
jgi:hypothetical protein